jgi:uncharacterized membrane protein
MERSIPVPAFFIRMDIACHQVQYQAEYGEVNLLPEKIRSTKDYLAFFSHTYPADLILAGVVLAAGSVVIYLPFLNTSPLRFVFALLIVLFIPGYCGIAALYPKENDISLIERIALSFGLSIAVVPLIGFVLNFTPWGIRLDPIILSLCVFTLVMILVAYYRRALLPPEERFRMPVSEIVAGIKKELFPSTNSRVDRLISITLTLVMLIALLSIVYVFTVPKEGEQYTEFFILDENRTTVNYPNLTSIGHNYPMFIGVGNHENRNVTYTIETWMLQTEFNNETNTSRIVTMDPNDRNTFTLTHNQTLIIPYTISMKKTGYDRVEFLLFNESVPHFDVNGRDRINVSYRNLHLWAAEAEQEDQAGIV